MILDYHNPTRLVTGVGCITRDASLMTQLGRRCMIVTGASSAKRSGALDDVTAALKAADIGYEIFDAIEPNPSVKSCAEAARRAADFGAAFIVGIGGGSALDAAKAVAVLTVNDMPPDDIFAQNWPKGVLPIVAVGTTAGTGSEVTAVTVLGNAAGLKTAIKNEKLYPFVAYGDPRYTYSAPYDVTVSCALDALSHAVESWFNQSSSHISDLYAKGTLELIYPALLELAARGPDAPITPEVREKLYYASLLGGYATARTGTSYPHRFSYFLTESMNLAHGTACCVFVPAFLRRAAERETEKSRRLCAGMAYTMEDLAVLVERLNKHEPLVVTSAGVEAIVARAEGSPAFLGAMPPYTAEEARRLIAELMTVQG